MVGTKREKQSGTRLKHEADGLEMSNQLMALLLVGLSVMYNLG